MVVTVIIPEVTDNTLVELTVKLAVPAPTPVTLSIHDGASSDNVQLVWLNEITELLLFVIATTIDSFGKRLETLMVAKADSPATILVVLNEEITNSGLVGVDVGVGVGVGVTTELGVVPPAEQEINAKPRNIIKNAV